MPTRALALLILLCIFTPSQVVAQVNRSTETATFQSYDQREMVIGVQVYTGDAKSTNDRTLQSTAYQDAFWSSFEQPNEKPMSASERRQFDLTETDWVGTTAYLRAGSSQISVDVIMASTDDYLWTFFVSEGTSKTTATEIINDTLRFEMWAIAPMGWGMMIDLSKAQIGW